jgi:hypothetical protein
MKYKIEKDVLFIEKFNCEVSVDLKEIFSLKLINVQEQKEFIIRRLDIKKLWKYHNKFKLILADDSLGIIIPVLIFINNDSFRISVQAIEIVEQFACRYRIMNIAFLPELLNSNSQDKGFYLLPNYGGVRINLNTNKILENRDRIYMEQCNWEKMALINCFGKYANKSKNILGIVSSGDFNCYIKTELNIDNKHRLYPEFELRNNFENLTIIDQELELTYKLFPPESDYFKLAKSYHKYLIEELNVFPLKQKKLRNPVLRYSLDALRIKIFMGVKTPFSLDGSSKLKTTTSFKDAEKIIDAFKEAGISRAVITLVGWNFSDKPGTFPGRFPIPEKLGGEDGLKKLIKKAIDAGYQIVPHDNVTDTYLNSDAYDPETVARTPQNNPVAAGLWSGGLSYKNCPRAYLKRYGYDFNRLKNIGFQGHYYMDAQSTVLWECHDPRHPANAKEFALSLAKTLQVPQTMFGAVSLETASVYSIPFTDEIERLHTALTYPELLNCCSDNFKDVVEGIPFYAIALHGLVIYHLRMIHEYKKQGGIDGIKKGLLLEAAMGAKPVAWVAYKPDLEADNYLDSINDLKNFALKIQDKLKCTYIETIEDFKEIDTHLYQIKYSNGYFLEVNASNKNWEDKPPYSLKIIFKNHSELIEL